jgi:hypothetical protein
MIFKVTKEELYGKLDSTTLEWTDGLFTAILRKIINLSGGPSEDDGDDSSGGEADAAGGGGDGGGKDGKDKDGNQSNQAAGKGEKDGGKSILRRKIIIFLAR